MVVVLHVDYLGQSAWADAVGIFETCEAAHNALKEEYGWLSYRYGTAGVSDREALREKFGEDARYYCSNILAKNCRGFFVFRSFDIGGGLDFSYYRGGRAVNFTYGYSKNQYAFSDEWV